MHRLLGSGGRSVSREPEWMWCNWTIFFMLNRNIKLLFFGLYWFSERLSENSVSDQEDESFVAARIQMNIFFGIRFWRAATEEGGGADQYILKGYPQLVQQTVLFYINKNCLGRSGLGWFLMTPWWISMISDVLERYSVGFSVFISSVRSTWIFLKIP